jgi:hypothetical protein
MRSIKVGMPSLGTLPDFFAMVTSRTGLRKVTF